MSTQTTTTSRPASETTHGAAYASSTHTVAPGITMTITGRPGHWTVWTSDEDGELHFAGTSDREKPHVAATEVHDRVVDAGIRAAGLQEMARADRAAAAELAARRETTQALWDALRSKATAAPQTASAAPEKTGRGRRRGKRGGRRNRRGGTGTAGTVTVTTKMTPAAEATTPTRRRRTRKPAQAQTTRKTAARVTGDDAPAKSRRRPARRARKTSTATPAAAEASTATTTAAAPVAEMNTAVAVAVVAAPIAPARRVRATAPAVAQAPAVPDVSVSTGDDDDAIEVKWAVYGQVDAHDGQDARVVGELGLLGDALSGALRGLLGDREAGRVRKLLRAGGLITGPTVYQEPAPRALRVAAAPVNAAEAHALSALSGDELAAKLKSLVDSKTARTKARPLSRR